jgi:uncharacterized DUF497 family protein
MTYEWDEAKRLSNIEKHKLDFFDADLLFSGPLMEAETRTVTGELRWLATGMIDDLTVTVVFTRRGDAIRLISLRRARRGERAHYHKLFGGGP